MDRTTHKAIIKFHETLHGTAGMTSEIIILKTENASFGNSCDALVKGVSLCNGCTICQHACHLRISHLVRIQDVFKAQGSHLGLYEITVFCKFDLIHAAAAAHDGTICHLVIEDIPLVTDFADRAVIISIRIVTSGIYECALKFKRSRRRIRYGIYQLAARLGRRVDHVVLAIDLTWRACLEEVKRRRAGNDIHFKSTVDHFIHVVRVDFEHVGTEETAVNIYSSVIVDQYARINEDTAVRMVLDIVFIAGDQLERTFRLIGYCYASGCILNISVEIVFAVFFHYVRCKETTVCPVRIRWVIGKVTCGKSNAVGCPVRRVGNRGRPYFQTKIAELVGVSIVMRSVDIDAVAEYTWFAVRNVFPHR